MKKSTKKNDENPVEQNFVKPENDALRQENPSENEEAGAEEELPQIFESSRLTTNDSSAPTAFNLPNTQLEQEAPTDSANPLLNRRDLLKAAAIIGAGLGAGFTGGAAAEKDSEPVILSENGSIAYYYCNKAVNTVVKKIAFSPGHSFLAVLGDSGRFRIWKTDLVKKPEEFRANMLVTGFAWGKNERLLLHTTTGKLACFDVTANESLFELSGNKVLRFAFSPDGEKLILLSSDWDVQVLDAAGGTKIKEFNLAGRLKKLPANQQILAKDVRYLGLTHEATPRLYFGTAKNVVLADADSGAVNALVHPNAAFDELIISENAEKIGYLTKDPPPLQNNCSLEFYLFPSGQQWRSVLNARIPTEIYAFAPNLDFLIASQSANQITVQGLKYVAEENKYPADMDGISCVSSAWQEGVFAWGGKDGRVMVGTVASSISRSIDKQVVMDPAATKILESATKVKLPYSDCVCTCNTVEVTQKHNERISEVWDEQKEIWTTKTQPCGSPLPAGAVCICNCVSAVKSPLWREICTCNSVCTCNSQGYRTYSYWY